MKTCNFRGARPLPSPHHGLFLHGEPQIRYGMVQCRQRSCRFCFPTLSMAKPVVQFTSAQKHRFINGYEAILNCPTVNVIHCFIFVGFVFSCFSHVKQKILSML